MLLHSSVLCSPVTAHGTFWTQSGNFLTRPRVSQTTKRHIYSLYGANSDMNWHTTVSCAAAAEQDRIMAAINEYHAKTSIRLVRYFSPPSGDYVHITGENSGCWSFVGRIRGVSNRVQGDVKTSAALRTAPLGFDRSPNTNPGRSVPCYTTNPWEHFSNHPVRTSDNHPRTSWEFTNDQTRGADSWTGNMFSNYLSVYSKLCLVQAGDCVIVQQYVCVTPPVVQRLKWLRNTNLFMYFSVQRHDIHSSSTLRYPSIKLVWCIILLAKPSCFLCPPLPSCQ